MSAEPPRRKPPGPYRPPPPRPRPTIPVPAPPTPGKGPAFWWSAIAFTAALALYFRPPTIVSIPRELHGNWRTDAPRYATRRFVIADKTVTFQTGDDSTSRVRYFTTKVRATPDGTATRYVLEYSEAGTSRQPLIADLIYRPGQPAELQFRSQTDVVWKRSLR